MHLSNNNYTKKNLPFDNQNINFTRTILRQNQILKTNKSFRIRVRFVVVVV